MNEMSTLFYYNFLESFEDQPKIEPERMPGDIFEIDSQLVLHDDLHIILVGVGNLRQQFVLVAVADRGHVRNARTNVQHVQLFRSVYIDILPYLRPRSNKAHVPDEHVDQLWQFIEFVLADEISRPCNPRVMPAHRNQSLSIRAYPHRAELIQPEIPVVASDPCLEVKDRPGGIKFNPNGQQQEQRTQNKESATACHEIENTFQRGVLFSEK